ncbi:MAG TPA: VWA domain-containing protein [Negativicutes bacterium]|jgi:hypothetical protein
MKQVIIDFARMMREAGVAVTTPEVEECLAAYELLEFDIVLLRNIMQLTLVKSVWETPVFENLFDLYFLDQTPPLTVSEFSPLVLPGGTADGSGRGTAGAGGAAEYNLLSSIDGQPPAVLEKLAQCFVADIKLADGSPRELATALREVQVFHEWFAAVNRIERRYAADQLTEAAYRKWLQQFALLEEAMRRELQRKAVRQFGHQAILPLVRHANIRQRDFNHLSSAELMVVEQEVAKMARKLAERPGIRLRRAKRGAIDLRRTFRNVVSTGGVPVHLWYRDKIKSKVDLWLLCDVSNSVERFSRFMLQLVQAAHRRYVNIRSFVFVDRPLEVTEWFRDKDVAALLEARQMRDQFSCRVGLSRYDLVFEEFARSEITAITPRTKLIILGDGRNNWRPAGQEELRRIAERTQAIYWLNPLAEEDWHKGDCVMEQYIPYCRQAFECRNLEQLAAVAAQIL